MSISHFSCKVGGLKIKEFLIVGKSSLRAVLVKFWAWSPILKLNSIRMVVLITA